MSKVYTLEQLKTLRDQTLAEDEGLAYFFSVLEEGTCPHSHVMGPLACVVGPGQKIGVWRWVVCEGCGAYKRWNAEEKPYNTKQVAQEGIDAHVLSVQNGLVNKIKADKSIKWVRPNA